MAFVINFLRLSMIILADLPPPIHGMANINKTFSDRLIKANRNNCVLINSIPSFASRYFNTRFWIPIKVVHSILVISKVLIHLSNPKHKLVYRPINGGKGQLFDIVYFVLFKLFRKKIYVHHHAFNYLNKKSIIFLLLCKIAGANSVHIVLGNAMKNKLIEVYSFLSEKNIRVLSNRAFFDLHDKTLSNVGSSLTIGYLSNISIAKGISKYIDLCKDLKKSHPEYNFLAAGPFADDTSKKLINEAVTNGIIEYRGPLYGKHKNHFFCELDIFVYPSFNEAEPLVLYEAAQHGVLIVGSDPGCMNEVINLIGGASFSLDDFTNNAIDYILKSDNSILAKGQRQNIFMTAVAHSRAELTSIIEEISEIECVSKFKKI